MPTFFARRYSRKLEAVTRTEKALGILILLLVAGIVAALAIQVTTNRDYLFEVSDAEDAQSSPMAQDTAPLEPQNPFPDPELKDWRRPRRTDRFTADDLYVKIDGQAEAYLQFHVVGLTFGTYEHKSDPDSAVDVYWYDMGEPANAQAMYHSEEAPGAVPVAIGREGYQAGGAVFFWKGPSYVQLLPTGLDESHSRAALKIAQCLAERIEDGR